MTLYWTRERVITAIHEWRALYDAFPSSYEWNPSDRRHQRRVSRYTSAQYPHTAIVVRRFGSRRKGVTRPRLLELPHGHQTMVSEDDWLLVRDLTLYRGKNGYVYYSKWENGRSKPRTLHGLLMQPPKGMHVDHINGDQLDNRRENLRVVTPSVNQANRQRLNRNNTSGHRGVGPVGSGWRAQITVNGKNRHLGMFDSKDEAVAARREAEIEAYGEACP